MRVERIFAGAIGALLVVLAFTREVIGFVADVFQVLQTITGENPGVSLASATFRIILLVTGLLLIWLSTRHTAAEKEEIELVSSFKAVLEMKVVPAFQEGINAIAKEAATLPETDAHLFWAMVKVRYTEKLDSYKVNPWRQEPFEPRDFEHSMLGAWAVLYELGVIYENAVAGRVRQSHGVLAWFERVAAMEKDLRARFGDDRVTHTKTLSANSVAHVVRGARYLGT